jgi:hypothetical protein
MIFPSRGQAAFWLLLGASLIYGPNRSHAQSRKSWPLALHIATRHPLTLVAMPLRSARHKRNIQSG